MRVLRILPAVWKHGRRTVRKETGANGLEVYLYAGKPFQEGLQELCERGWGVMVKLYISGPITGIPDYKEKFMAAAKKLEGTGAVVLNPATLPDGMNRADYMRICLSMVDVADMVVLLPGWENSACAMIEKKYAEYQGKLCATIDGLILAETIRRRREREPEKEIPADH